jgi:TatA/E family protein of Tat protein translocase
MPFINGIGAPELIIILIIALIVVGPGRLPDVGSALGKSIREFRKAATDVKDATSLEEKPQSGPGPADVTPAPTAVPATAAAAAPAIPSAATAVAPPPTPAAAPETTGATDAAAIEAAAVAPTAAAPTAAASDATAAADVSELPEPVHAQDEQPTPTA